MPDTAEPTPHLAPDRALIDPSTRYADILRGEIRDGRWQADTIRTREDLVDRFGTTLTVIARTVAHLTAEGVVETRSSVGVRPKIEGRSWHPAEGTQTQHVREVLRARITGGVYRAGRRLPTQVELAQEFGVSRTTISGVLRPLRTEGLLRSVTTPRRGVVVTAPAAAGENGVCCRSSTPRRQDLRDHGQDAAAVPAATASSTSRLPVTRVRTTPPRAIENGDLRPLHQPREEHP
ncbi:GntR family transcriptional regulator [Streptomyces ipomoeae]|uniref:GntR family transcriptional regulator n=1 Tax=Streptomyces ipomoeae TaxID=103232 RepID=UPI0029B8D511|nr:GntR family transcriptional regulator [Streptomyces ipomoeae]MDX2826265.1 GntR family transcriptional regulator [Streptomyces ipomoeae]MDX2878967.1 GntR family transcriptional regulator [Streptomyces ipomoeae]